MAFKPARIKNDGPDNLSDVDPALVKIAGSLLDIARGLVRETLVFMFVLRTGSDFLINAHIRYHYSLSVMASWNPTLGLTPQYFRGQRLVDR